jgi:hypothetical protein
VSYMGKKKGPGQVDPGALEGIYHQSAVSILPRVLELRRGFCSQKGPLPTPRAKVADCRQLPRCPAPAASAVAIIRAPNRHPSIVLTEAGSAGADLVVGKSGSGVDSAPSAALVEPVSLTFGGTLERDLHRVSQPRRSSAH